MVLDDAGLGVQGFWEVEVKRVEVDSGIDAIEEILPLRYRALSAIFFSRVPVITPEGFWA